MATEAGSPHRAQEKREEIREDSKVTTYERKTYGHTQKLVLPFKFCMVFRSSVSSMSCTHAYMRLVPLVRYSKNARSVSEIAGDASIAEQPGKKYIFGTNQPLHKDSFDHGIVALPTFPMHTPQTRSLPALKKAHILLISSRP